VQLGIERTWHVAHRLLQAACCICAGARLEIERVTIADSVQSSALLVEGEAIATACSFVRCHSNANAIFGGVLQTLVPNGVGAYLAALGGAITLTGPDPAAARSKTAERTQCNGMPLIIIGMSL
jgi:hypothetical protein